LKARLESINPVLMSRDVSSSVHFYARLGFSDAFQNRPVNPQYAGVRRDEVELHLQWQAESQWAHPIDRPTYRICVREVDALYAEFRVDGVLEPEAPGQSPWRTPGDTPWGTREFHVLDPDGNGLQFYRVL